MKNIDLMIFDFDGTLVDSGGDLANAVNFMLQELNLPHREKKKIITFIGDGVHKLIERSLGDAYPEKFDEALYIFTDHYQRHMCDTTVPYPGVMTVLNHFYSKPKIIMTNKLYHYTLRIAEHLKIAPYFEEIIGADSTDFTKPDPQILFPVLQKYGVDNNRTLIVGDGVNDILLARKAGVVSCAFLGGLTPKETLISLEPDYMCEHLDRLTAIFN
ncbi:MAG: HAD-IA family hydrolase [Deltaproteobacteria bacterium]|nr:HAD-IA family hydrolase [Deltaproteobacteria bacterium]